MALGPDAVEPLLRALADETSPAGWREIARVLGRIGDAGFDGLLRELVQAPAGKGAERVGFAFADLGTAFLDHYRAALRHPSAGVRRLAVRGIQRCEEAGLPALPSILSLLGDPDRAVAGQARDTLILRGRSLLPQLRRIRAHGPGRQRAGALTVLAELGGEPALSARDGAAIERLVRTKLVDDRPEALWGCWNHWIAVPGGDQAGIIKALGLVDPRPVTFALGNDIVDADGHGRDPDDGSGYARVFVTPELDGWTLVLGAWCDPCGEERSADVLRLCGELSRRYGQAQAYYYGGRGDGSAWLVAERGAVLRRYRRTGEEDDELLTLGAPLPYERDRRTELGLPPERHPGASDEDEEEWQDTAHDLAPELAAALSVNPLAIGPDTPSHGVGVVALTPYGVEHGVPAGAYRI